MDNDLSKFNYCKSNEFEYKHENILRIQFWYYEYLKRHLILYKPLLIKHIFSAINYILNKLEDNFKNLDKEASIDLLKRIILQYYLWRSKLKLYYLASDIIVYIISKIDDEDFRTSLDILAGVSREYGYFANSLLYPRDMEDILEHINSNLDVADIACDTFAIEEPTDPNIEIMPPLDSMEFHSGDTLISLNIINDNFNITNVLKYIKTAITLRRNHLRSMGVKLKFSSFEISELVQHILPQSVKAIHETSDRSRAIGLWCFDKKNGLLKDKYIENFQKIIDGNFKNDKILSTEDLFKELVGKKLIRNFFTYTTKGSQGLCQESENKECLLDIFSKDKPGNDNCIRKDSCIRRLEMLIKNATKCVDNKTVIPIAPKTKKDS
ncbi:MAG: hypothetical protein LBT59_21250 [Clostridiales bacterium]|jgi:hypothetical protein|nr:hypothetical protein [Clostridiales bacterium]